MSFPAASYLDLTQTAHPGLFPAGAPVWETLKEIKPYLALHLQPAFHGEKIGQPFVGDRVYVGPGTVVEPGAVIKGPAWIGANCEIRTGAYIRENVIIGDGCVIGNSCEFKNCLLFNGCQVPHYTYVGDSILGAKAHLGAGVILSNFKLTGDEIVIRHEGKNYKTGLRKFGAIIGDGAEIGCQSVLNPGSILGRHTIIYPGIIWRGVLPEGGLVKNKPTYDVSQRRVPLPPS